MPAGRVNEESANPTESPSGPVNPVVEFEKVCEMAAGARAFRPNMNGEGEGDGDNGEWLDSSEIQIEVETGELDGTPYPMLYWTVGGVKQRVHTHQAFLFHPDTARELKQQATRPQPNGQTGKVVVVDTGWVAGTPKASSAQPWDIDPLTSDVAHEHGPAIADLLAAVGGAGVDVYLRQVRFDLPNEDVSPAIPVFEHTDKHPVTNQTMTVRGFTDTMLMATLELLEHELVQNADGEEELLLQEGDVVNLSLGAVAGPGELNVPGDENLYAWLARMNERGVNVVCAAGNHGTVVPTWPAAHGTSVSPFGQLDNVYAVGSGTTDDEADRHHFSAHGWVPYWRNGSDVGFDSHYGTKSGAADASWSGTSFSAPQFALSLL